MLSTIFFWTAVIVCVLGWLGIAIIFIAGLFPGESFRKVNVSSHMVYIPLAVAAVAKYLGY